LQKVKVVFRAAFQWSTVYIVLVDIVLVGLFILLVIHLSHK